MGVYVCVRAHAHVCCKLRGNEKKKKYNALSVLHRGKVEKFLGSPNIFSSSL